MNKPMETGLDVGRIRRALDREEWEDDRDSGGQVRRVFLGTVFSLTPSGKYYTPFACSNVMGCPCCDGSGSRPAHRKRRIVKKWRSANERRMRCINRMRAAGRSEAEVRAFYTKYRCKSTEVTCGACGGLGSREAHLDELWREQVEADFSAAGLALASGEGDLCDLFAEEYREKPDEDAEDAE